LSKEAVNQVNWVQLWEKRSYRENCWRCKLRYLQSI